MLTKNIDALNVLLILISLLVAFYLPFELFLFSYAVLGPLHYLTEIQWLNKKNFFVSDKRWAIVLLIVTVFMFAPTLLKLPVFGWLYHVPVVKETVKSLSNGYTIFLLAALLFAIALIIFKQTIQLFIWVFLSLIISALLITFVPFAYIVAGIFLPTIVHVYLFTLLFMIYGALNNKTYWGVTAIIFLIICPIIIIFLPVSANAYVLSDATKAIFHETGFNILSNDLAKLMHAGTDQHLPDLSVIGIKVQIFIAFCYTYHYLNWFSKTSVIGWSKQMSKANIAIVIIIWVSAVVLYCYNYVMGIRVLSFLSILHVLLEFPLNVTSIKGIANRVVGR